MRKPRSTPPPTFFDDDVPDPRISRDLVLRARPGRPLGRKQRTFNRLVARIEDLQDRLQQTRRQLDEAAVFHSAQVAPRAKRAIALQTDLIRALRPFLEDRRFKPADRRVLRTILAEQLDDVVASEGSVADDLRELFEQLHGADYQQVVDEHVHVMRSEMEAMFGELGIDLDLSGFRAGMTQEEMAAKAAEMSDELRHHAERARSEGIAGRRRSVREQKEEERLRRIEDLRKTNAGKIYRQLARVLHPDLEQDAEERRRKSALMQELTAAHANDDLYTLLRLEIEWIHREETDASRLTGEKLDAYNELLREQAAGLEAELDALPYHPRYAATVAAGVPFGPPSRIDGPEQVRRLDALIAILEEGLSRMRTADAWREVRDAIEERRTADRFRDVQVTLVDRPPRRRRKR